MKSRTLILTTFVMLASVLALGVHAQSGTNCCNKMEIAGQTTPCATQVTINGRAVCTAASQVTNLTCTNTQTNKGCTSSNPPPNTVTATGAAAQDSNGNVIACPPTFNSPNGVQNPIPSLGTQSSYTNEGTSYTIGGGICVPEAPIPTTSVCPIQACTTGSGGGGHGICQCDPSNPNISCSGCSPIIIDVSGNGFALTSAANGVTFDISGSGNLIQMGWIAPGANNAFLALPGPDGLVHTGQQLFGNFTPQPPCPTDDTTCSRNGFRALAVYDLPANGGNGDGIIDARDGIFSSLRLWIDANHDGVSQPNELYTLPALGINSISLNYKRDAKSDQYGNTFRYRAQINPGTPTDAGKTAYDVFFVVLGSTATQSCPARPVTGKRPTSPILKH